jgi:hypothetical protein
VEEKRQNAKNSVGGNLLYRPFTSVLGIALGGFHNFAIAPKLIGNLVITAAAAFCWLYWTLKKYYVRYEDLETFDEESV